MDSKFICIKPRENKKELLINIYFSNHVLMTYKHISIIRKEDYWEVTWRVKRINDILEEKERAKEESLEEPTHNIVK